MFHHFHDDIVHHSGQGSIDKKSLLKVINIIGRNNILNADDFLFRYKNNTLTKKNVCFTFDDALQSQVDVAIPILNEFEIKAFFFVYTSIYTDKPSLFEACRYFRINYYKNIDEFYKEFFLIYSNFKNADIEKIFIDNKLIIENLIKKYPVYSDNDSKFRLIRDNLLSQNEYDKIMIEMFKVKDFDYKSTLQRIFINKKDLKKLHDDKHVIGLHSHSHPYHLQNFNYDEQKIEYEKNIKILSDIISNHKIISMSHPLGLYNDHTFKVLKDLNVTLGFRDDISKSNNMNKINNSNFELAREDVANILKRAKL
tara:strand:+ start:397 stop:1329 length:933 start_codon:yes stop_codon:yes gene_type:complete